MIYTFAWVFSSGEKTHADFAWFWPLWLKKSIHLCMFFFCPAKKPMQISHDFGVSGSKNP
jgi:hypothetical protein